MSNTKKQFHRVTSSRLTLLIADKNNLTIQSTATASGRIQTGRIPTQSARS